MRLKIYPMSLTMTMMMETVKTMALNLEVDQTKLPLRKTPTKKRRKRAWEVKVRKAE